MTTLTSAPEPVPSAPLPAPAATRLVAVDAVRGLAVLGILLLNILSFGLPEGAYQSPRVYGGSTGADLATWFVVQVLFEGKMRALFSMLFGAGIVLFTLGRPGRSEDVADSYYRRTLWLVVLGWLHGLLLWEGDILFTYGISGIILYLLRRVRPAILLLLGVVLLTLSLPWWIADGLQTQSLRQKAEEARAIRSTGETLTREQEKALNDWQEKREEELPSAKKLQAEINDRRGGYASNFQRRKEEQSGLASLEYADEVLDACGAMLLGMGLFKLGVFSAARSRRFYLTLVLLGYGLGVSLGAWVAGRQMATDFEPGHTELLQTLGYHPCRIAVALGHVGVLMLLIQSGAVGPVIRLLAAAGRMALTNYLMQTVLCTTFFYGYGLGWFAHLSRAQMLLVVVAVWALELTWSPLWLRYFQFGPAEWLWRWLTYLRRPPLRRSAPAAG